MRAEGDIEMTEENWTGWALIAAPLEKSQIKQRQQKNTVIRYISRDSVIYRLNQVCPGEWSFKVEMISTPATGGWVAKGSLTIRGVTREDFGVPDNADYFDPPKAAASDALKRCASQFGFALELYGDEPQAPSQGATPEKPASASQNAPQSDLEKHFGPRQSDDLIDLLETTIRGNLIGQSIARIKKYSQAHSGTRNEFHWNNRYKHYFGDVKLHELDITVADFVNTMATPSSDPQVEEPAA